MRRFLVWAYWPFDPDFGPLTTWWAEGPRGVERWVFALWCEIELSLPQPWERRAAEFRQRFTWRTR